MVVNVESLIAEKGTESVKLETQVLITANGPQRSDYPDWSTVAIEREGWRARPILGLRQLTVNGNIPAACADLAIGVNAVGLWGLTDGDTYVVRLTRDRALIVSERPIETDDTWHASGWVASCTDDAFLIIELSGPTVVDIILQGTSANLHSRSASASALFAGVAVSLYRSDDKCVRIHVANDIAPYLWRWLETSNLTSVVR